MEASVRRAAARCALALAAVVAVAPAPARAADCSSDSDCPALQACVAGSCQVTKKSLQDGALAIGIVGDIFGAVGLGVGGSLVAEWQNPAFRSANPGKRSTALAVLYGMGALSLALGGLSVAIQASQQPPDCSFPSECQGTYVTGGTAMGMGGLLVVLGIYVSATPPPAYRRAFILPVPIALSGARGPVPGVGLSGFRF
jgi:hypothetical protein